MTNEQVKQKIQKPKNTDAIQRGQIHARRLKFHGDMNVILSDAQIGYLSDFMRWVSSILPADKYDTFQKLMAFPIQTNELTETIYSNLHRVFDGKDRTARVVMKDEVKSGEFETFFNRQKFREEMFRQMRSDIDSVIVCDLPSMQEGEYPEPYYYFVGSDTMVDICVDDGEIEYVIYKCEENEYICVDDEYWRKLDKDGNLLTETDDEGNTTPVEIAHNLGYCPARFMWTALLASGNDINHKAPITSVLGDLDRLLFNYISKDYADLYAGYPLMVAYAFDEEIKGDTGEVRKTKEPNGRDLMGPGSLFTVTPPTNKDDPDLNTNPIQVIGAEVESLEYLKTKNNTARESIFKAVVGADGEAMNNKAVNEKQVEAGFESRKDVLMSLKVNFETAEQWLSLTLAHLRYGDMEAESFVDYGVDFYLYDESDILTDLNAAKTADAPDIIIASLTDKYFEAAYRNDPDTRLRMNIIRDLDPLPNMSRAEVMTSSAYLPPEDVKVKVSMDALIRRFERENTIGLNGFGSAVDYKRKIETINQIIRGYVRENDNSQPQA